MMIAARVDKQACLAFLCVCISSTLATVLPIHKGSKYTVRLACARLQRGTNVELHCATAASQLLAQLI